jgi:hypothetical protein
MDTPRPSTSNPVSLAARASSALRIGAVLAAIAASWLVMVLSAPSALAADPPLEGIFESCSITTMPVTCLDRLNTIQEGGFKVVVVELPDTPLAAATYAAAANALGMKVMWETSDESWWSNRPDLTPVASTFGQWAAACGCTDTSALLSFIIGDLAQLPGTYGYYGADDSMIAPGDRAGVAAYVAAIKRADPTHPVMIGSADSSMTHAYEPVADMVAPELYPVTTDSLVPVSAHSDTWDAWAQEASDAQRAADVAHHQSAFILQAFTWGDNIDDGVAIGACSPSMDKYACNARLQYPSEQAQLELRNEVLLHAHPALILWWSFQGTDGQAGDDTYSIYPTGATAAARWTGLTAAINAPLPVDVRASASAVRHTEHPRRHASRRHRRMRRGVGLTDHLWRRRVFELRPATRCAAACRSRPASTAAGCQRCAS